MQSPIERSDYSGLQLDTRAQEEQEKFPSPQDRHPQSGHWSREKWNPYGLSNSGEHQDGPPKYESPNTIVVDRTMPELALERPQTIPPQETTPVEERRIGGMKRRTFFILLGLVIAAIILVGVVVGAVVGTRSSNTSAPTPPPPCSTCSPPSAAPSAINNAIPYVLDSWLLREVALTTFKRR
jgi:hypothetical protein